MTRMDEEKQKWDIYIQQHTKYLTKVTVDDYESYEDETRHYEDDDVCIVFSYVFVRSAEGNLY